MGRTQIRTNNIEDDGIGRDDLNVSTSGRAVVRKIIQGSGGLTISSTGADSGTGDVTINLPQGLASNNSPTFAALTINGNSFNDALCFKSNNAFSQYNKLTRFSIFDTNGTSANVWYKILTVQATSVYSIAALRFAIDISEDGSNYAHIIGKIRLRTNNPMTSNTTEWYYDVIGHSGYSSSVLNDLMRVVKDVDDGSQVSWSVWVKSPESWIDVGVEISEYRASVNAVTYHKSPTTGTPGTSIAQSNRLRYYGGSGDTVIGGKAIISKLSLGVVNNDANGITPLFYGGADGAASGYLDGAGGPAIYHGRRAGGTQASRSNVSNGQAVLEIRSAAYSGATGYWDTAKIAFVVDGNVTDNQRPPTRIDFYTNQANGALTHQLTLDAAGNLFPSAGQNLGTASKMWGNFYMNGAQIIGKRSDTGSPTQDTEAHAFVYESGDGGYYFVIKWNDGGTVRYRYIRLDGTTATWTHSTTLP